MSTTATKILPQDIEDGCVIDLPDGYGLHVKTEVDSDTGAPGTKRDGHGPVSDYVLRFKRPGEMVLYVDGRHKRYYDFAEAVKIARRDGWGVPASVAKEIEAKLGRTMTKGEIAHHAAMADYERLRQYCAEQWTYIGVVVTLLDPDHNQVSSDSLWRVESDGDYWKDVAADMGNALIERNHLGGPQVDYQWLGINHVTRSDVETAIAASMRANLSANGATTVTRLADGVEQRFGIEITARLVPLED